MLSFESTVTHQSKVCPGVEFAVRRLNQIQRAKRDWPIAKASSRLHELRQEYIKLAKDVGLDLKAEDAGTQFEALAEERLPNKRMVDFEIEYLLSEVKPAVIKAGLLSITGLIVDAKVIGPDDVAALAPSELIDEIYVACQQASTLSAVQEKN